MVMAFIPIQTNGWAHFWNFQISMTCKNMANKMALYPQETST